MTSVDMSPQPARQGSAVLPWFDRVARLLLLATVIAVAAAATRDFSRYTDHYPYVALDDSLGNVSYTLAADGHYGFPISPIQGFTNIPRNRAFFNYGPWYFYAGAALIWMFGYSIGVLRALHLLGILAISAGACWWFGRRRHMAAGALVALGLLYSFDVGQWPMIRPDIAVSVFAVMFVLAAGLAIEHFNRSLVPWFVAGLAAGCAALTHLVAWALVPCCGFTVAIALVSSRPGARRALASLVAVVAGLAAATVLFYASFGFRIREHLELLRGYGGFLGATPAGDSRSVLAAHLQQGFWYLSPAARLALGGGVLAGAILMIATVRGSRALRTQVLAVLLPPVAVLCFYTASLASYRNYHAGYSILVLVGAWWCAGALVSSVLWLSERRSPAVSRWLNAAAMLVVIVAGAVQFASRARADSNPRLVFVNKWVSIQGYTAKIGDLIAKGTTAWGTPIFGIDSPNRFELVDAVAAVNIVNHARASQYVDPVRVAPAYLVWGYSDNRENTEDALNMGGGNFNRVRNALNPLKYRVVGLVAAEPYGVTRVYQRLSEPTEVSQRLPAVSAFDPLTQLWDGQLEGPQPVQASAAEPAVFDLRFGGPHEVRRADQTFTMQLPAGRYLLRVRFGRATATVHPTVIAVTSAPSISEEVGDLGPSMDFAPYVAADEDAYLLHNHPGGALYVSQFDRDHSVSVDGIDVYRIVPELHSDQRAHRSVFRQSPLKDWLPFVSKGVRARLSETAALVVDGDATPGGYQIESPLHRAPAHSMVTLRPTFSGQAGRVCLGALSAEGAWLANGGNPSGDFEFTTDAGAGFRAVFYNCNPAGTGNDRSQFSVSSVRYAVVESGMYVDALLRTLDPATAETPIATTGPTAAALRAPATQADRIKIPTRNTDLAFRAQLLRDQGEGWILQGDAEGRFAYLLQSKPITVTDFQLVVKGVMRKGGISVGLVKNQQWAAYVNVTDPGPFTVVVAPPIPGETYNIVVAHALGEGPLTTDLILERIGWAPLERR